MLSMVHRLFAEEEALATPGFLYSALRVVVVAGMGA